MQWFLCALKYHNTFMVMSSSTDDEENFEEIFKVNIYKLMMGLNFDFYGQTTLSIYIIAFALQCRFSWIASFIIYTCTRLRSISFASDTLFYFVILLNISNVRNLIFYLFPLYAEDFSEAYKVVINQLLKRNVL